MNHLRSRPPEGATPVDSPGRPEVLSLEAACEKARSLVQEALRARPGWRPPPFDPRVYAELLGVAVSYTEEPVAWDAILLPAGGSCESFRIVCNAAVRSCRRMAFSLAHEIA
ncbi:MAG: hypothetical protein HY721_13345, partial [Planctomycetes bacterium]|nr:hypothetical protein [Planctomycetota bacterium]